MPIIMPGTTCGSLIQLSIGKATSMLTVHRMFTIPMASGVLTKAQCILCINHRAHSTYGIVERNELQVRCHRDLSPRKLSGCQEMEQVRQSRATGPRTM